mmetsp:Transcript_58704/g.182047  ORF Transcript_58704/g.182047 Transcript_58704/m.182047 type:complete len:251 (-) Transcript_58704:1516-2268(-)
MPCTPAASNTLSRAFSKSSSSPKALRWLFSGSSNSMESMVSKRNKLLPMGGPRLWPSSMLCVSSCLASSAAWVLSRSFFSALRRSRASSQRPFCSRKTTTSSGVRSAFDGKTPSKPSCSIGKDICLALPCASIFAFSSPSVLMPARLSRAVSNRARFSTSFPLVCRFCARRAQQANEEPRIHLGRVATYRVVVTTCSSSGRPRCPYIRMARPHCWMKALGETGTSDRKVRRTARKLMPSEHCWASATSTR